VNTDLSFNPNLLFVYGTLMQGFDNPFSRKLQKNARWHGKALLKGKLYDLGHYPGAIYLPDSPLCIHGEIWELGDFQKNIVALDRYEGTYSRNPEYIRQQVPVILPSGQQIECWTYLFCRPVQAFTLITEGDYRKWIMNK